MVFLMPSLKCIVFPFQFLRGRSSLIEQSKNTNKWSKTIPEESHKEADWVHLYLLYTSINNNLIMYVENLI